MTTQEIFESHDQTLKDYVISEIKRQNRNRVGGELVEENIIVLLDGVTIDDYLVVMYNKIVIGAVRATFIDETDCYLLKVKFKNIFRSNEL